jgi:hypothetical protein
MCTTTSAEAVEQLLGRDQVGDAAAVAERFAGHGRIIQQLLRQQRDGSVKAVVAEPHFPQANLQFCQGIHGKPWTPP